MSVPPKVRPHLPGFKTMPRKLVHCRAGDLVLWDSRTIHCNTPAPRATRASGGGGGGGLSGGADGSGAGARLVRAVAYVCMTPARLASAQVRRARRAAYETRTTTAHWPHELHAGGEGTACGQTPLRFADAPPERRAFI